MAKKKKRANKKRANKKRATQAKAGEKTPQEWTEPALQTSKLSPDQVTGGLLGDASAPPDPGGFESAKKAAADDTPGSDPRPPTLDEEAAGLVATLEMTMSVVVRAQATALRIDDDELVERLSTYSRNERARLLGLAPMAVPYLRTLVQRAPIIGAIGFGMTAAMLTSGRLAALKHVHREQRAADSEPTRSNWGDAEDVGKGRPGPRRRGFPPKFTSEAS